MRRLLLSSLSGSVPSVLIVLCLSRLAWLVLLGRPAPPYKGGGGRLTCGVLLGLGYLLQVGKVSPFPIMTGVGLLGFLLMGHVNPPCGYPCPISPTVAPELSGDS